MAIPCLSGVDILMLTSLASSRPMRVLVLSLAALLLAATACVDTLPVPNGRFGTITAGAYDNGGGSWVMRPEAAFYDKTDLSYVPAVGDTCVITTYSPIQTVNAGLLTLNAGEFLFTSIGGRADTMIPQPGIGLRVYTAIRPLGIPFTPGDTLTVTVPGSPTGFPASAISIRTAEAFTHAAVGVPAENVNLPLTWTAAPSAGSQMTFSLRYASSVSGGALNEQVFCSFTDDGAATINANYLDGWRTALNNNRSTRALRVRSREVLVDGRTRLSLISSYGQPLLTVNF